MRDLSRLRRSHDDRMIAGVCEGLSRHFDVDPLLIRVVLGALTVFGGAGIVLYVLAWLTIPEDDAYDSIASRALHQDPERTMEVGLVLAGIAGAVTLLGAVGFATPRPFAVIVVSLIALAMFLIFSRRRGQQPPPGSTMPYGPMPAGSATSTSVDAPPADAPQDDVTPDDGDENGDTPTATIPTVTPEERETEVRAWWQRSGGSVPPGGVGPSPYPPGPPPRGPKQRSRLTPITLAVMAIALGGIWFADVAGADIHPSVYPGTVLALTAAALLVGTWYGRAKLLIPIGILSALLTAGMTVIGPGPYGERVYEPTTAAAVKSSYEHGAGRIVVNLDDVSDPDELDGRSIDIESRVGLVQVVVPTTVDAAITAHVRGGEIEGPAVVDDADHGSQDAVMDAREDGRPIVTIDVDLRYGKIEILRYDCPQQAIAHEGAQPTQDLSSLSWKGGDRVPAACH